MPKGKAAEKLEFVCPYTENTLIKPCNVINCPAYTVKHKTHCAHVFFKKPEIKAVDVAFIKDISEPKAKRLIDVGSRKIQKAVLFHRFLNDARAFHPKAEKTCACGLKKSCIQSDFTTANDCKKLQRNKKILQRFPWNIPILKVTPPDIYSIFRMREKLQNSLKKFFSSNDNRVGLQAFLDLSVEEYETLAMEITNAENAKRRKAEVKASGDDKRQKSG